MKVIIGVTRNPERIKESFSQYNGLDGTLTEIGPFVSKLDALNWLVYLKSRIADFQEIIPGVQSGDHALWYGFTFEQETEDLTQRSYQSEHVES